LGSNRRVGGFREYLGISDAPDDKGKRAYSTNPTHIPDGTAIPPDAVWSKMPWEKFQVSIDNNINNLLETDIKQTAFFDRPVVRPEDDLF
jgi:hypothetical protein